MAVKKQTKRKSNNLKVAAIALVAVMLLTNLYIWWSPGDILNTISTTLSSTWWALLIPVSLMAIFIFWVLMLIDAANKNKIIWFLFILLAQAPVGLLYFLVEKPKIIRNNARLLGWITLGLVALSWLWFTAPNLNDRAHPFDISRLQPTGRRVVANVVTKDLKGYKYEGRTICREMTLDDKYYVMVSGGRIVIPKDRALHLNYILSAVSGGHNNELGSGWESFEGQPDTTKAVDISHLLRGAGRN